MIFYQSWIVSPIYVVGFWCSLREQTAKTQNLWIFINQVTKPSWSAERPKDSSHSASLVTTGDIPCWLNNIYILFATQYYITSIINPNNSYMALGLYTHSTHLAD